MRYVNDIIYKLPQELEQDFATITNNKNKNRIRVALLAGILMYSAFGFLDNAIVPELEVSFFIIRFAVVIPITLLVFLATYSKKLFLWIQPLLSLTVIVGGLGIIYMILVAPPAVSEKYYAGLILVFIYGYTFLRVNFIWSSIAGWFIVFAYELIALFILHTPAHILISNNFFFISANLLGMFASISYEYYERKQYYTNYKLENSRTQIINNNIQLEKRVLERTEKLAHLNKQLVNENEERKKIESSLIASKEEAEKANQLKSQFLAQVSHEIRSPINTIINFTSLIKDLTFSNEEEDLQTCFTAIESASKRVVRTIDLILNTSELQLGTYESSLKKVNIVTNLKNLQREYMGIASSKGLDLILEQEENIPEITTDDYAVNQIFANLLDNAIKYTKKGTVKIILKQSNENDIIVIIEDTGNGISEEYLPNIFQPFTQEEEGYTRRFEGNGLGLSLVKKYCDLINADISIRSNKNVGTSVQIILPN